MKKFFSIVPRWIPALLVMITIFALSSQPGDNLPNFLSWDYLVKKGSHVIGYGLLALSYLYLFLNSPRRYWYAWFLVVVFSASDEFHQSFVAGRHASIYDVIVFDNFGALVMLLVDFRYWRTDKIKN